MGRMYASHGFQQRDNYASNYAAKNVKSALDKLIDVLQSPEQVRRLVIGHASKIRSPTKPSKISFETPAKTPMWMETAASVAKHGHSTAESEKTTTSSSGDNPSDKRKTRSAGGIRASDCNDSGPGPPGCSLLKCNKFHSLDATHFNNPTGLNSPARINEALTNADMPLAHLLCDPEGKYVSLGRYHQVRTFLFLAIRFSEACSYLEKK